MDIDDSRSCLDALKTLTIECVDGDVQSSPYVLAALAEGAPIVREALSIDPRHVRLPFCAKAVADAMVIAHAPSVEFRSADPPFHLDDIDAMRAVADVFDFLGARAYQDYAIELSLQAFKRLPIDLKGSFMNVVVRHSDDNVWGKFVHAALHDAIFWTDFKRGFIDKIDAFSPRIVNTIVDKLSAVIPPAWIMTAACRRMRGALDANGVLELAGAPYAERSHPAELYDIMRAAAGTIDHRRDGRASGLVLSVLKNVGEVADPGMSSPLHGGDRGAAGSIIVFEDAISILASMRALAPPATPRRRTLHKFVSFTVSSDGFSASIDVGGIDGRGAPRYVACRMSIESEGVCEAEEWFFEDAPTQGKRFLFETGRGILPRGGVPIARAAEYDLAASLRVDVFYNESSYGHFHKFLRNVNV
jgi:hypothetical protein